ncbi:tryptophan 7-halogenase [Stakelama sediminis]|uniref:Tryptophan halogenase n=1 Tax=Stakelama sediminis TaxID=463200 RepID=A0A840YUB9_9SPHN|nr:tryptophan 7-halogenase [Stakelama sediminis]MBB5717196.1 tryptophan halogenase [Stakelama sediminis]
MTASTLSRIAVVGGGQVALLAATALARALPNAQITLVRTTLSPAALADLSPGALPVLRRLHQRIGIDEAMLLHRAGATHRLATSFNGWRPDGGQFLIGYGAADDGAESWTGKALNDAGATPHAGPAAALAAEGKFALPEDTPGSPLADLDYALRFDPAAHANLLAGLARHLNVTLLASPTLTASRDDTGRISRLTLADGTPLTADLYIDCTGPERMLHDGEEWQDWSAMLPVNRVAWPDRPLPPSISPRDEVQALDRGYRIVAPSRDRTHVFACWSSSSTALPDAETARHMLEIPAGPIAALTPGRLASPWSDNSIAIGDAAAAFEPLQWLNLHLARHSILLMLDLLPGHGDGTAEAKEFNRRFALAADRVRDFVAAHHVGKHDMERSPQLARTLNDYARRGRLPPVEEDSIPRDMWVQLLSGLGIGPGLSARVRAIDPAVRAQNAHAAEQRIAAALAAGHPYSAALKHMLESP